MLCSANPRGLQGKNVIIPTAHSHGSQVRPRCSAEERLQRGVELPGQEHRTVRAGEIQVKIFKIFRIFQDYKVRTGRFYLLSRAFLVQQILTAMFKILMVLTKTITDISTVRSI